jgi:hypothetical protein
MMADHTHKVFGLGLSRTGTTSLGTALNRIGINTIHYPYDAVTQRELEMGSGTLSILNNYQAIVDISVVPFYRQLDRAYPGSRFILTVRDVTGWLTSVGKHLEKLAEIWESLDPQFRVFSKFIIERVYGSMKFDAAHFQAVYEAHLADVREYFRHRPADLLILNISDSDVWVHLCPFLGVPVPNEDFPRKHDSRESQVWLDTLAAVQTEIASVIPARSRFILVDQNALTDAMFDDRIVAPLVHGGMPANDKQAMTALECLKADGFSYLVFAWPAYWWFEHYIEFTESVRKRFPCIWKNERMIVFSLNPE